MIRNYLKTALRSLWKNKTFGFLNIIGLSIGIACAALILLWVENETSYNNFFPNKENLYHVLENQVYDGKAYTFAALPGKFSAMIKAEIPEIKNSARVDWGDQYLFSLGDKSIYELGQLVDPEFIEMFSLSFISGDPQTALSEIHSLVITEKMAKKFFPDQDAVGKSLKVNKEVEFIVTGVIKDLPSNSSLQFQWLAPFKIFEEENRWTDSWGTNGLQTYVELKPKADPREVNKKLYSFIQGKDTSANARPFLFALKDWRLRSNFEEGIQTGGRIEYVRMFSLIALIILIIACINFMNLATARSEQRSREVGVRKVMGAGRRMLVVQFIGESLLMSFISVAFAILILLLALPGFNQLVSKHLTLQLLNPIHLIGLIAIGLISGLLAGSYPSLYLSSFNPISVFKGFKAGIGNNAALIRKGLVITQFVISIVLIVSTVLIYQQIQHIKNRPLGYEKDHLIYMNLQGNMDDHFDVIRHDLVNTGVVENVALANSRVLEFGSQSDGFEWQGKPSDSKVLITQEYVSAQYIPTMGMHPIGQVVKNDGQSWKVIGVVKDFIYSNMYGKPDPLVLFCYPTNLNYMFVRFKDGTDTKNVLAKTEAVLKSDNPGYPFDYKFFDAEFDNLFRSEMLIGTLSRLFAILAIFITCLGLFGLAAYTAERRTKEIGIRKVLGATVSGIVTMLSRDFIKLVSIAAVIAFPIAWLLMHEWLQNYAYSITINGWVFLLTAVIALTITLFTVSFQAIKAAVANPVKSLRME
jgi:ABC-type antimicrobial peptide transport system permease subunit